MSTVNECPKCGFSAETEFGECPKCGIIVSKFIEKKEDDADETRAQGSLDSAEGLKIKQLKESFTDADNFGVAFPANIDVNHKAILLGAVFLIDFVHFESKQN